MPRFRFRCCRTPRRRLRVRRGRGGAARLHRPNPDDLAGMVDRRVAGLPLEHVLGWAEFCGLRIAVDPGVFVPRRRTEFLVEQALALAGGRAVIVDLCCGSGAVGAALVASLGEARAARRRHRPDRGTVRPAQRRAPPVTSTRATSTTLPATCADESTSSSPASRTSHRRDRPAPREARDARAAGRPRRRLDGLDIVRRVAARPRMAGPRRLPTGRDERPTGRRPRRPSPAAG